MKKYQLSLMRKVYLLSACFLIASQFSCKDEGDLNPNFVNDALSSQFSDVVKITAQVKTVDSILTDGVSSGLVGVYKDSVFGNSTASFYVQPLLISNFQVFYESNETYFTDSVVLTFPYTGAFGDSGQTTLEVYRLDEKLETSTVYYSDDSARVIQGLLGSKSFYPDNTTNVTIARPNLAGSLDTLILAPQVRIPLDNSLGDEILAKSGLSEVENNANFTTFFKGLKVQPSASIQPGLNEVSILSLALTNIQSKMSIFYTVVDANGDTSKKVVDFPITSNSVRFNSYSHSYIGSAIENQINDGKEDSLFLYASGMAGIQTELQFPLLKDRFKDSAVVINRAELILPLAKGSYTKSGFAEALILASKTETGDLEFLEDFFEGQNYFGGSYDISQNAYVFNINRYVQSIISGKSNSKALVILVEGSATSPERAALFGPAQSSEKIKLNLYYSNTLR